MIRARPARAAGGRTIALAVALGACAVGAGTLGACAGRAKAARSADPAAIAAERWPAIRRTAQTAALARDFAAADSTLRTFTASYPDTPSAVDALYWRALVRLEAAGDGTPSADALREVRGWLDAYIAGGALQEHYLESLMLRRVTARLDSLRAALDAPRPTVAPPTAAALAARDSVVRARDDELSRLRTELDQTRAELDRIRRRIAPRRP